MGVDSFPDMWFHGQISRVTAETRLIEAGTGTGSDASKDAYFLVRESATVVGLFCLSIYCGNTFFHSLILRNDDDNFFVTQESCAFRTIPQLIQHFKTHELSPNTGNQEVVCAVLLTHPCSRDSPPQNPPNNATDSQLQNLASTTSFKSLQQHRMARPRSFSSGTPHAFQIGKLDHLSPSLRHGPSEAISGDGSGEKEKTGLVSLWHRSLRSSLASRSSSRSKGTQSIGEDGEIENLHGLTIGDEIPETSPGSGGIGDNGIKGRNDSPSSHSPLGVSISFPPNTPKSSPALRQNSAPLEASPLAIRGKKKPFFGYFQRVRSRNES